MSNIKRYNDYIDFNNKENLDILDAIIIALEPLKEQGVLIEARKAYGRKDMVTTKFELPEKYTSDVRMDYIRIVKELLISTYPKKSNIILMLNYSAVFDMKDNTLILNITLPK